MNELRDMFKRGFNLSKNFIPIGDIFFHQNYDSEHQDLLARYIQLLQEEAVEYLRELPARKFWRPSINGKKVDVEALREELADLWHILIAISIMSGCDEKGTYKLFVAKNEKNLERVKNNS